MDYMCVWKYTIIVIHKRLLVKFASNVVLRRFGFSAAVRCCCCYCCFAQSYFCIHFPLKTPTMIIIIVINRHRIKWKVCEQFSFAYKQYEWKPCAFPLNPTVRFKFNMSPLLLENSLHIIIDVAYSRIQIIIAARN